MENRIGSYPSIYAVGHRAIQDIFKDEVFIEEKIDGSQFSFMYSNGELLCRSKGTQIIVDAPEKMFAKAVETARSFAGIANDGWIYRCEYLSKPKHNTLCYGRAPDKNLILFDVVVGIEKYLSYNTKTDEAKRLGLECVPLLFKGIVKDIEAFNELLERKSILGGCDIEGMVIKNYKLFTQEKKIALAKYVSEKFKEKHQTDWKKANPTRTDMVQMLIVEYRNENRWEKAIQHLRDDGKLEHSPRDIGMLIKEVPEDILKECKDEIKEQLFKHFWPQVRRGVTAGLPEWYKQKLAESAF